MAPDYDAPDGQPPGGESTPPRRVEPPVSCNGSQSCGVKLPADPLNKKRWGQHYLARGRVSAVSATSSLCEHSVFCTAEGKPLSELSTPTEKVGGAPAPAESVFSIFKFGEGFGAVPLPERQEHPD